MKQFKTESKKLLDLVINSIYTNKDIFLRELISNASDALDRVFLRSLEDGVEPLNGDEPEIELSYDVAQRIITVSDCGIGMNKDELEANLGTIAHSATLEFKQRDDIEDLDVDTIGQFGVGFYSAFMVADHVTVISRAYGSDQAYAWTSDGIEGFEIKPSKRDQHGTDVILHLRENADGFDYDRFLSHAALSELVKRYSDYIRYPIVMETSGRREVPKPADARNWEPTFEDFTERLVLNSRMPIWTKSKSEVSQDEYDSFYMKEFDDTNPPLRTISMHARGAHTCDVLLFIPKEPTADFYSRDFKKGLALYSSHVMIMERCTELIPEQFGFVRGIVDSPDISLNLSRETLQHDEALKAIADQIQKRVHAELECMRDNERELYIDFFGKFGRIFKFAIYTSFGARNALLEDLLLFFTAINDQPLTLKEYVEKMPDNQPYLFFASGARAEQMENSPSVRAVTEKGFDVLLCTESIDEFCLTTLREYAGKPFKNVAADDLGLDDAEDRARIKQINDQNQELFSLILNALGSEVVEVSASIHLGSLPASVSTKGPLSLGMEKYFAAQPEISGYPQIQHILELNPDHKIFKVLQDACERKDIQLIKSYATILYGQSLLSEGLEIKEKEAYAAAIYSLMEQA